MCDKCIELHGIFNKKIALATSIYTGMDKVLANKRDGAIGVATVAEQIHIAWAQYWKEHQEISSIYDKRFISLRISLDRKINKIHGLRKKSKLVIDYEK